MLPEWIKKSIRTLLLRKRFPSSVIHSGVSIDRASFLEPYSVLFSNVAVIESTVGRHSYVQASSQLYHTQIGPFCSIAANVIVGLANHPTDMVSTSPVFYDSMQPLPFFFTTSRQYEQLLPRTIIGADVWIGQGAMIKAGVSVGVGVVIGAGAVVTRDVAPYSIVAGVPAHKIKMRFEDDICRRLADSKWWEFDSVKLQQLAPLFAEPDKFLEALETFEE